YSSKLCLKILVAPVEIQLGRDLSAGFGETLFEEFCETFAVVALHIGEDGDLFCLESFCGEIRHYRALKRINETNAKNIIAGLGNFGVGRGGRDHWNLVLLAFR